jgi:hypothetical protein
LPSLTSTSSSSKVGQENLSHPASSLFTSSMSSPIPSSKSGMATESDQVLLELKAKIRANEIAIKALEKDKDDLTWAYVHKQASNLDFIEKTMNEISTYLGKHYDPESVKEFIELCNMNLVMAPIQTHVFRISKYNTRVGYNTVLYQWKGKRIMYIRASSNCDNYYEGCDDFNGFSLRDFEFSHADFPQLAWWKTDELPSNYTIDTLVEKRIKSSSNRPKPIGFDKCVADIPDEYKLIVALFDLSDIGYPYLIGEEKIKDVGCLLP